MSLVRDSPARVRRSYREAHAPNGVILVELTECDFDGQHKRYGSVGCDWLTPLVGRCGFGHRRFMKQNLPSSDGPAHAS